MTAAIYNFTIEQGTDFSKTLYWQNPVKEDVVAVATSNITLSGTQTIDGISLAVGNRVLVTAQTTASQNGIYLVSGSSWTRTSDMDSSLTFTDAYVHVATGTTYADTYWKCTTTGTIFPGVTSVTFAQENSPAIDLTGWTGAMEIKVDGTTVATPTVTVGTTDGSVKLELTNAVTAALDFDVADYDLKLTDTNSKKSRLVQGKVSLSKQITV